MNFTRILAAVFVLGACGGPQPGQPLSSPSTLDSPKPSVSVSPSLSVSPSGPAIGRDRAIALALERTGGGAVDEVEHEVEHGRAAWKVRVVKDGIRYDVYLDQATGEIFRFEDEGRH